uniref:RE1 silencing transcription factor n=1 Tax=Pelusios castaneus TaxID=367368 RepID=A0A8C8RY05_9SAUR
MATQVLGQSGGNSLFAGNANIGMALSNDMYDLHDLSKAELAAPQLIMLANVALTGEVNGSCCDYLVGEERQMAELRTVGDNNFSDSDGEGMEDTRGMDGDPDGPENMELGALVIPTVEIQGPAVCPTLETCSLDKDLPLEAPDNPESVEDKCKSLKSKPFRCKPCQYEAECEEEFVHHIRVHSAKKFIVEENREKHIQVKESDPCITEEADFSKGPIRCDRCGYNTNRYDHYLAHLKHHNKAGENERVYKCTICTYTTVSEYHWKKHLRNHFPRKVYTCSQCSYFSDRKNNYIQHIRTHTGERPYQCAMCPYSSSQKTHLTRHMRTHSGEKPFKCDQCIYVASNQHEVTRHARQVHNGPKPLTCPHCDYKTADRSNFKKHVELHVNPRQFLCPVCDYAASKKCNLQYHIKSRHPDCSDITMDVSKVKLRTKKSEADFSESVTDKMEKEQIRDFSEKKNERAIKVEKKESSSKEKKPASSICVGQVTTRSRKSVSENKEVDIRSEKSPEKSSKTKKTKRKAEAAFVSSKQDPADDTQTIAKKKKKVENKSRNCQEAQKSEIKLELPKKLNSCLKKNKKKKALNNKQSKKSNKLDQEKIQDEVIPEESPLIEQDKKGKSDSDGNDQQKEQNPVVSPLLVNADGQSPDAERQPLHKECVQDQAQLPPQLLDENVELKVEDEDMPTAGEENKETVSQKEVENQPDKEQATNDSEESPCTSSQQNLDVPKDALPDLVHQLELVPTHETESLPTPDPVDLPKTDLPAEEPAPPQSPEKPEQDPKEALALSSAANTAANESQEIDEDEGIHSHDGSDMSDNMSEGSDDSGLNGARSVQEETSSKASQEVAEAKVAKQNYVCIFCDRSFKKEGEYSKHLNRHLVNVYYLEKATKGQE